MAAVTSRDRRKPAIVDALIKAANAEGLGGIRVTLVHHHVRRKVFSGRVLRHNGAGGHYDRLGDYELNEAEVDLHCYQCGGDWSTCEDCDGSGVMGGVPRTGVLP